MMTVTRGDATRLCMAFLLAICVSLLWSNAASAHSGSEPVVVAKLAADDAGAHCHGDAVCHMGGIVLGDFPAQGRAVRPIGPSLSDTASRTDHSPTRDPPVPIL